MVNPLIKLMSTIGLFFFSSLLLTLSFYANAETSAKLDRSIITLNESATLILQGEDDVELPNAILQRLKKNFDVRHAGNNSQTSCRNFSCTSIVTANYQLTPKSIGLFSIPAMKINGSDTQVLQLKVKAANNNPNSAQVDPVFIETEIDKQEAYVQEQVLLTFKINNSIELRDLSLEQEFLVEDAIIKLINQTNYERQINGRLYNTAELTYSVLPQKSGALTIPAINIQALVSKGGFRSQRIRLKSDAKILDVKANPTTSIHWLPAKQLHISESFSADIHNIQLGDSITRTITTTAVGLAAEQLPPISIKANRQFKAYPDQAKMEDKHNAQGIVGVRTDTIAIVATKPGKIDFPAITIEWWDVVNQQQKTTTLAAVTLTVLPNPDATEASKPAIPKAVITTDENTATATATTHPNTDVDNEQLTLWKIAFSLCFIAMLVFAFLYIRQLKSTPKAPKENCPKAGDNQQKFLKQLEISCKQSDAKLVRQHLISWAKIAWPTQAINSTMDIAHQCKDIELQQALKELDATLYNTKDNSGDFNRLFMLIEKQSKTKKETIKNGRLAKLYPVN